jgi:hypothetical protein
MCQQLGDLGLDLVNVAAQEICNLVDPPAGINALPQVGQVQVRPRFAAVDVWPVWSRFLTHTQHGGNTGRKPQESESRIPYRRSGFRDAEAGKVALTMPRR